MYNMVSNKNTELSSETNNLKKKVQLLTKLKNKIFFEEARIKLSPAQEGLWFESMDDLLNVTFNIPVALRIRGEINFDILQESFSQLFNAHPVFKLTFGMDDTGKPYQFIDQRKKIKLEFISTKEENLYPLLIAKAKIPFDITKDNLLRTYIMNIDDKENVLMIVVHHIIFDGESMSILSNELWNIYSSIHSKKNYRYFEDSDYFDFIHYQIGYLSSELAKQHKEFWARYLNPEIDQLDIPKDYKISDMQSSAEANLVEFIIDRERVRKLISFAQQERVSLFAVLFTMFKIFLYKYTYQKNFLIGIPISLRTESKYKNTIGNFVNIIPILCEIDHNVTLSNAVADTSKNLFLTFENRFLPFSKLFSVLKSKENLLQVSCSLHNWVNEKNRDESLQKLFKSFGLTFERIYNLQQQPIFDLSLEFVDFGDYFRGFLKYNDSLFNNASIKKMVCHFTQLISEVCDNFHTKISEICLLTPDEKELILNIWNDNRFSFKTNNVCKLLSDQVVKTPHNVALVFNDQKLTYVELERASRRLALYLVKHGAGSEVIIGVCLPRSMELAIVVVAIIKAGAAYLPLDANYPKNHLKYIIDDAKPLIIITTKLISDQLNLGEVNKVKVICFDQLQYDDKDDEELLPINENHTCNNLFYLIYTSGSTGKPKGVLVENKAMLNLLLTAKKTFNFNENDKALLLTNFTFDIWGTEFFLPLISGGTCVIVDNDTARDPFKIAELIDNHGITFLQATPSMWQMLMNSNWSGKRSINAVSIGEVFSTTLAKKMIEKIGSFWNAYGPTECVIWVTMKKYQSFDDSEKTVLIGKPIDNIRIYILDNVLNPVPIGVKGELYCGGIGLARGYLNNKKLTDERFIDDPFVKEHSKVYKTGDIARYNEVGEIEFFGREDNMVKMRGFRIELGEIENCLRKHSAVKEAVVVCSTVNENKHLIAYLMIHDQRAIDQNVLRDFLANELPEYMVPNQYIVLNNFPLNASGKIDRNLLLEYDWQSTAMENKCQVKPQNEVQAFLVEIWQNVLGLTREIGINENFFELGGDSIIGIQVVSQVKNRGIKLSAKHIFQYKTIAELSRFILRNDPSRFANLSTLENDANRELDSIQNDVVTDISPTDQQKGMMFDSLANDAIGKHIEQLSYEWNGDLDLDIFKKALFITLNKHDIFRFLFSTEEKHVPTITIVKKVKPIVIFFDITNFKKNQQTKKINSRISLEQETGFALHKPPLIRCAIFKLAEKRFSVLWTYHHIIMDGWSTWLFAEDFYNVYIALHYDRKAFPNETTNFSTYLNWLKSCDFKNAKRYWMKSLVGFSGSSLPGRIINDRKSCTSRKYGYKELVLTKKQSKKLLVFSNSYSLTLNTIFSGLWAILLGYYNSNAKVIFGVTVSGRSSAFEGIHAVIGPLINTLPSPILIEPELQIVDWLQNIQLKNLEMQDFDFSSLGQIRQWCNISLATSFFESLLVFENYPMKKNKLNDRLLTELNILIYSFKSCGAKTNYFLAILVSLAEDRLKLDFIYDKGRFDDNAIKNLISGWKKLLIKIVDCYNDNVVSLSKKLQPDDIPYLIMPKNLNENTAKLSPRNAVEKKLLRIWQELFKRTELDIKQNFFALGGHSLLAAKLIQKINENFANNISINALFQNATVEKLADYIIKNKHDASNSPIIYIRGDQGSSPIFFIHPPGGNVICYYELANYFPHNLIYAIQDCRLFDATICALTVEKMAEKYIEFIKQLVPTGPYCLIGYSGGGIIAFEMAQQLLKGNERIKLLALIDIAVPKGDITNTNADGSLLTAVEQVENELRRLNSNLNPNAANILDDGGKNYIHELLLISKWIKNDQSSPYALFKDNLYAVQSYKPKMYDGKILIFRAKDTEFGKGEKYYDENYYKEIGLGWEHISNNVAIYPISGNHITIMTEPNASLIARICKEYIL